MGRRCVLSNSDFHGRLLTDAGTTVVGGADLRTTAVCGGVATAWMNIAQAFAGGATDGPAAGTL